MRRDWLTVLDVVAVMVCLTLLAVVAGGRFIP